MEEGGKMKHNSLEHALPGAVKIMEEIILILKMTGYGNAYIWKNKCTIKRKEKSNLNRRKYHIVNNDKWDKLMTIYIDTAFDNKNENYVKIKFNNSGNSLDRTIINNIGEFKNAMYNWVQKL